MRLKPAQLRCGVLVYVSSTTARLFEPFMGPYVASKAAGEALAEVMGFEASRFGIESVIVVPGAFTSGTEHFAHAQPPAHAAVTAQSGRVRRGRRRGPGIGPAAWRASGPRRG